MLKKRKIPFYISDHPADNVNLYIMLQPDNWDDYTYKTTFKAFLYNSSKQIEELGEIKIAYIGD